MTNIAVLDDYQNVAATIADWSRLPAGTDVQFFHEFLPDEDARAAALAPFDTIIAMRERTPFPRSLLERLPNLKLLVTTGGGNASFDLTAAKERGIVVSGTGGRGRSTSELAWGLILALTRRIAAEDANIRKGGWQIAMGPGLFETTLGIVGLGNLGSQVATVGKAFGMNLIAWSPNLTQERAAAQGAKLVTKDELFAQSDVISVHLVLSDRSRGLIGARELELMKPTAFIVNTSRGPIIDETALVDALRNNRIAGAGLDVFDREPLPLDHPFRSLENTVLTPHIGYVASENYEVFYEHAIDDVLAFLDGKPVREVQPRA
jgi:phosphoglycerate dehydrogenase-like enzyme